MVMVLEFFVFVQKLLKIVWILQVTNAEKCGGSSAFWEVLCDFLCIALEILWIFFGRCPGHVARLDHRKDPSSLRSRVGFGQEAAMGSRLQRLGQAKASQNV